MGGLYKLLKKSWRSLWNMRRTVKEHSSFKVFIIVLFAIFFTGGLWALFVDAFWFLEKMGGVGLVVIRKMFSLFFFGLGLLITLSSIITAFGSLYRSEDITYLLRQPVNIRDIVYHKYLESTWLSSWAFGFIIIPFVGAYAYHEKLPWAFSLWTLVYSIPFIMLCSAIALAATMVFIRWVPLKRMGLVLGILLPLLGGLTVWYFQKEVPEVKSGVAVSLANLVPGLKMAAYPLWPSRWVSEGIMATSRGQWPRAAMLWSVLVINLLLVLALLDALAHRLYYESWQRIAYAVGKRRRGVLLLRGLNSALFFLPSDIRAVMVKDIRTFFRDAAQWSQSIFFFGLLAIYFLNLRNLHYDRLPEDWRNIIALLNVFSIAAVLSSLGCRFVYPQLSLEGHSFWVLGLSPSSMGRILAAKFALALVVMLVVCAGLMTICVKMLRVNLLIQIISLAEAIGVACSVAGLSIGLGAIFADLRQRNPSVIVSSFGGTLNLVLCLGYIMATLFPFAFILHLHRTLRLPDVVLYEYTAFALLWLLLLTLLMTTVPLLLGRRSLMRREY